MKKFCFCFDVKNGSNVAAMFTLVTRIIEVFTCLAIWATIKKPQDRGPQPRTYADQNGTTSTDFFLVDIILGFTMLALLLGVAFSTMLIIGNEKNIRCLFWPWMITSGIEIGLDISAFFLLCASLISLVSIIVPYGILLLAKAVCDIYMLCCVIFRYKSLPPRGVSYQSYSIQNNQFVEEDQPLSILQTDVVSLA